MLETLQQLDTDFLLFLNSIHSPFWDDFMWLITAKLTWVPMYVALLYVVWKTFNLHTFILSVATIVLVIVFADQVCGSLIRSLVERWRPSNPNNPTEVNGIPISDCVHLLHDKRGGRYGFPSCHAANSFALACIVLFILRNKMVTFTLFLWATLHSYSRVYMGVHYPGDLIVGALVGALGAYLIYLLYRKICLSEKFKHHFEINRKEIQKGDNRAMCFIYTFLLTVLVISVYSLV